MYELVAVGQEPGQGWRRELQEGETVRLGRAPHSGWETLWDLRISREHADLTFRGGALQVRLLETARNSAFFDGQRRREFFVRPGQQFRIGSTSFRLESQLAEARTIPELEPLSVSDDDEPQDYDPATDHDAEMAALRSQIEAMRRRREQAVENKEQVQQQRLAELRSKLRDIRHEINQQEQSRRLKTSPGNVRANPPVTPADGRGEDHTPRDKVNSADIRALISEMEQVQSEMPPELLTPSKRLTDSEQGYIEAMLARLETAEEETRKSDPARQIVDNEQLKQHVLSIQDEMADEAIARYHRSLQENGSQLNALDLQALRTKVQRQIALAASRISDEEEISDSEQDFRRRLRRQLQLPSANEPPPGSAEDDSRGTVHEP